MTSKTIVAFVLLIGGIIDVGLGYVEDAPLVIVSGLIVCIISAIVSLYESKGINRMIEDAEDHFRELEKSIRNKNKL